MADTVFSLARGLSIVALCVLISSCRSMFGHSCHEPPKYAGAEAGEPLKIPEGLDAPDTTQALRIPELNTPEPPPRSKKDPCLDEPPAFTTPKPAPEPSA